MEDASCGATPPGGVSASVKVTGDFGSKPKVSVTPPTQATKTERTVVIGGNGALVHSGDTVNIDLTLLNGTTGQQLTATNYDKSSGLKLEIDDTKMLGGFVKTIQCSRVGSRVVGVIPPVDAFGETGSAQLGVGPGQDIVAVIDVISIRPKPVAALPAANGKAQPAPEGFPKVTLAKDGTPTVTIPHGDPPTTLKLAELKTGSGAKVKNGDDVVVHYVGVNWNTKVIFDSSWAKGQPATFNSAAVIKGFTAALVGHRVGSQVIVIIPPDQGYGSAGSPPNIGGKDTLVFVVDILGIA